MKEEFNISKIEYPHFKFIMCEMCNRVGANPEDINPKQDEWFREYTWTEEEQDDFKEWFVDYLYKNTKARRELYDIGYRMTKKELRNRISLFLFQYGWKLSD